MPYGDIPVRKMILICIVFYICSVTVIIPIVTFRESKNPLMQLLWMDGAVVMQEVMCREFGLSCKK